MADTIVTERTFIVSQEDQNEGRNVGLLSFKGDIDPKKCNAEFHFEDNERMAISRQVSPDGNVASTLIVPIKRGVRKDLGSSRFVHIKYTGKVGREISIEMLSLSCAYDSVERTNEVKEDMSRQIALDAARDSIATRLVDNEELAGILGNYMSAVLRNIVAEIVIEIDEVAKQI